jgi:hypothetical protein
LIRRGFSGGNVAELYQKRQWRQAALPTGVKDNRCRLRHDC